jgi:hypothetical protein
VDPLDCPIEFRQTSVGDYPVELLLQLQPLNASLLPVVLLGLVPGPLEIVIPIVIPHDFQVAAGMTTDEVVGQE